MVFDNQGQASEFRAGLSQLSKEHIGTWIIHCAVDLKFGQVLETGYRSDKIPL